MHLQLGPTNARLLDGSTSWDAAAENALRIWNANMGSTQFVSQRNSTAARADANGINNVFFSGNIYGESWGSGVLAVTLIYYSGQQMSETDVLFNAGYTWNSYRGPQQGGTIDFHRVALHEFGHAIGLDHPDEAGQWITAIMNAYVSDVDGLMLDDVSGARSLYGAPVINPPPVIPAPLAPAPVILTQPRHQTATVGDSVSFNVTVSSQIPVTYRWLKN
ncbi:MAG TPA: matrixin family metalloprotease, partial [Opitutaceae bacterium]|nr:matrixin family metalloprotease [Opitutaceae bacterium]